MNSLQRNQKSRNSKTFDMSVSIGDKYKVNSQSNIFEEAKLKQQNYSFENIKINEQSEQNNISKINSEDKKQLMGNQVKSDESKNNGDDVDDQSGKLHEKIGLVGLEQMNQGSVHSSYKSVGSNGGNFLKGKYYLINFFINQNNQLKIRNYTNEKSAKIILLVFFPSCILHCCIYLLEYHKFNDYSV